MGRALIAFFASCVFVCTVTWFSQHGTSTHLPFYLLAPGIIVGGLAPDAGVDLDGDIHLWGPIATFALYAINIALYTALGYFLLSVIYRVRRASE